MKLNLIIPTYNRPKEAMLLINDIYKYNDSNNFNLFLIDDNSTENYSDLLDIYSKKTNFSFFRNHKNMGKNYSILHTIKILPNSYCIIIDDKDRITRPICDEIISHFSENQVIGVDLFNVNQKMIGDKLCSGITVGDFYFKYNKNGDKIWAFNSKIINVELLGDYIFNDQTNFEDSVWMHFLWSKKICFCMSDNRVTHVYKKDGISSKIWELFLENKKVAFITNYLYFMYSQRSVWNPYQLVNLVRCKKFYDKDTFQNEKYKYPIKRFWLFSFITVPFSFLLNLIYFLSGRRIS